MAAEKHSERKARLARALKQNLKRRKAKADPAAAVGGFEGHQSLNGNGLGPEAGIASQDGLRPLPSLSPKTASKRN